jgi:hypothetical protein
MNPARSGWSAFIAPGGSMPNMGYDAAGLIAAAADHADSSEKADAAAGELAKVVVVPAAFGRVPSAAGFADAVENARLAQGRGAGTEMHVRADLRQRFGVIGLLSAGLTTATTRIAESPTPGSIANAMS